MMIQKSILIKEYVKALRNKTASIFIGAGMSKKVTNLDWKNLIKPYALGLGFKDEKSIPTDYPFLAQSYINANDNEAEFKKNICNKFNSDLTTNFHEIIARLPINNYWTTNYDKLIENALSKQNKHYDCIYDNNSFCEINDSRDHIVYKCHGDCKHPESIVITKADYENYKFKSFNFSNALYNELASSTILFLGYSFSDPDINNIIETLNALNSVKSTHYLVTIKAKDEEIYQQHWIRNLSRYGIKTVLIDDYKEIELIIEEIEKQYMAYNILISGSAVEYTQSGLFNSEKEAQEFINQIGYKLVEFDCSCSNRGYRLKVVNGNGKGVGPYLYEGIAEAAAEFRLDMADYLLMYPFPKKYYEQFEKEKSIEEKYKCYRENMVDKCGVVFFLFGNKYDKNNKVINADGVKKEFNIAVEKHKYVFPMGITGYMASELYEEVINNFERYNGDMPNVKKIYKSINQPGISVYEIIEGIEKIIDILSFRTENK